MRSVLLALALACPLATTGCGGSMPLWHGPDTLGRGDVRFGGGVGSKFLLGGMATQIRGARSLEARNGGNPVLGGDSPVNEATLRDQYVPGALAHAAGAPGLAPGLLGRVGLGHDLEAGVLYTGRSIRVDLRRSLRLGPRLDASLGVAAYTHLYGQPASASLPSVAINNLRGYGGELPALIGWHWGDLAAWGGARLGGEWVHVDRASSEPNGADAAGDPIALRATRLFAGPVVGARLGRGFFHLVVELGAGYETVWGRYGGIDGRAHGVALSPSSAVTFDF